MKKNKKRITLSVDQIWKIGSRKLVREGMQMDELKKNTGSGDLLPRRGSRRLLADLAAGLLPVKMKGSVFEKGGYFGVAAYP